MTLTVDTLLELAMANPINAHITARLPELGVQQCLLTAGCLFQAVWNHQANLPAAQGVKDYDVTAWFGVFAPAKLAPDLAATTARAFVTAQQDSEVLSRFAKLGAIVDPMSGNAFGQFVSEQHKLWGDVIKKGNIRSA